MIVATARELAEQQDAMFQLDGGPAFAQDAFAALLENLSDAAGDVLPGLFTELFWASLHGRATLIRAGRTQLLIDRLTRL